MTQSLLEMKLPDLFWIQAELETKLDSYIVATMGAPCGTWHLDTRSPWQPLQPTVRGSDKILEWNLLPEFQFHNQPSWQSESLAWLESQANTNGIKIVIHF